MRTTVELDSDTAAAVNELRRVKGLGLSAAVNELIRRALVARDSSTTFEQQTAHLGVRIDVSDVAEALELLEGPDAR